MMSAAGTMQGDARQKSVQFRALCERKRNGAQNSCWYPDCFELCPAGVERGWDRAAVDLSPAAEAGSGCAAGSHRWGIGAGTDGHPKCTVGAGAHAAYRGCRGKGADLAQGPDRSSPAAVPGFQPDTG